MSGFRIARIIGIPIYIHYTWFIIFGLIAWSLSEGYFPSHYPDLPASSYWAKGLVAALLLFASVLFHELGHSIVAIRNGIGIVSITLFIFGGLARLKEDPKTAWVEFKVAIAGPIASFILAGLFYAAAQLKVGGAGGVAVTTYSGPSQHDPGSVQSPSRLSTRRGTSSSGRPLEIRRQDEGDRIASGIGTFFAYLLILNGVYGLVRGEGLNGVWSILIGWFLKDASAGAYQQVRLSEMLSGVRVRDLMVPKCVAIPAHISIEEAVQDFFLRYGYGGFPVEVSGRISGLLSLSDVKRIAREEWPNTSVQAHMTPVDERTTIDADKDIAEALQQMAQSGGSRLVVVDSLQNCIGMITHNGILTRLRAQEALNG